MADVLDAPTQDAIAESLLGDEPQTQVAEQPEADQQLEQVESQPQEQFETQTEEQPEDWLPTDQEKVFPDDVLLKYAQRYNVDEEWLSNPLNRQLLSDKINSDIFIRQQQEWQDQQQQLEPEQQLEPTPQQLPTREQYFQNIDRAIAERTDPVFAKEFHDQFLRAFGVPDAEIAKAPPQQAMQLVQVLSRGALNLMNTFIPDMLSAQLSGVMGQAFPGFSDMYERSAYAMSWDRVRNSSPQFSALPAYGTKEFSRALREASARIPGFDDMQFTGRNGQPLGMMENAERKYAMLAQIASGQNVDPRLLQQAAAAQVKSERRAARTRSNGNLGSGQSRAGSGTTRQSSQFETNQDIFDDDTLAQLNTRL